VRLHPLAPCSTCYTCSRSTGVITNPTWQRHLHQISPSEAGLAIQTTIGADTLPIGPWAGRGVLTLWADGALTLGWIVLRCRDA
jgi:ABC-2 type transport system permease protein